ncbi:hypothetical protein HPNQ4099_1646 [Helicobacter pylori NQ4099]|uniref:Uncharacterized protein n=1 Tax=Helicobacter pylori NQ4099 TaxID=992026 RepID=I9YVW1_HELPX|nr:hypothetical protein HPNQ4099_1646 [Helicobacter pylori NQ4099]EJB31123.1 hypothetical protein HPNQ4228_0120 [Helicobacter pylori NQ4228]
MATEQIKSACSLSKKHPPFKKGGLLKNYRLIFNSKQNPKKLIFRYNV